MSSYAVFFFGFLVAFLIVHDSMFLHIHHYFLGLLLFPLTCYPTRLSMILQALVLGLFINGASRWGFSSLLETKSSSPPKLGPAWLNVTSAAFTSVSLIWEPPNDITNGTEAVYYLKMNDMLAYVGTEIGVTINNLLPNQNFNFCIAQMFGAAVGSCTAFVNVTTNGTWIPSDFNETSF
jgi:hypothetical protein